MRLADLKYRELKTYGHPVSQNLLNPDNGYVYRVMHHPQLRGEYSVVTAYSPTGQDVSNNMPIQGLDFFYVDAFTTAMLIARFEPTKIAKHKAMRRTTGTTAPQQ